jgi:hypothetical protein
MASGRECLEHGPPVNALVVISAGVDLWRSAGTVRRLVDSLDRTRVFPSVLVDPELDHGVLDELRMDGVPVMVQRPLPLSNGVADRGRRLLELAHWLRSSDARVVYLLSGGSQQLRLVRFARRFAPQVEEVIGVSLDEAFQPAVAR